MFYTIIIAILTLYISKLIYDKYIFKKNGSKDLERFRVGTHVIISGGSKGIGLELAKKFAKLGAHVTIIARNENDLKTAKNEIEKCRKNTVQKFNIVSLDLTKLTYPDQITNSDRSNEHNELLEKILGENDRCDILVNCCGSAIAARFDQTSQKQFDYMMQVNYFSAVNLTRLLLPIMKKRNAKNNFNNNNNCSNTRIVFVSSMCGLISFFGYSAYSASKFALVGLAEALHMELKAFDIGVTISFPPDTDTPGFEEENKTKPKLTLKMSESGNLYTPKQVAESIISDIRAKKFCSTIGLENIAVLTAMNTFMPASSIFKVILESFMMGPLKLVGHFILKSWYKIVDEAKFEIIEEDNI